MTGIDGSFSHGLVGGGVKRGGALLGRVPVGKGVVLRGSSIWWHVNLSHPLVGGAPLVRVIM